MRWTIDATGKGTFGAEGIEPIVSNQRKQFLELIINNKIHRNIMLKLINKH